MDRREFLLAALATALSRADITRERAAAAPALALATADTEAHVVAVSLATGRVRARTHTLEGPRSIERGPGVSAIVAHTSQGAISLLEGAPPKVRRVLRGFSEPRYTAVAGRYAFVTDSGHGEVAVVDLERGKVVHRAAAGEHARHVSLSPDHRMLWVALGSSAATITVLDVTDPTRPKMARRIRPPFLAHDVGFAPDGRRVWVTAGRENKTAIYYPRGTTPAHVLEADEAPQHVGFAGDVAYVTSGTAGTLERFTARTGARRSSTRIPGGSYNVQPGANRILTPSLGHGTLTILDHQGRVLASKPVARQAHDACVV
jgi:DNA-binding beta-propeller fold protein YncE